MDLNSRTFGISNNMCTISIDSGGESSPSFYGCVTDLRKKEKENVLVTLTAFSRSQELA